MNALGRRIAALIQAQGPLSIAQYMTIALHDPRFGYYATQDPLGKDFITAPEISQMFGELVGLWIVQCWTDQNKPSPTRLVELGPGRGTLMADALRAAKAAPDFLKAIDVELIEASPTLRTVQETKVKDVPVKVRWSETFQDTNAPLFLIANEFFDVMPIHQYVMTERGWCERMIVIHEGGKLGFSLTPVPIQLDVPEERGAASIGAIYETSPASEAVMEEIARVIATKGGAALIVDYGYDATTGFGETFQAMKAHAFENVLDKPGEADLTAHVDFGALARAAEAGGAVALGPNPQGGFLENLGIRSRAGRLAQANPGQKTDIAAALNRLVEPDQMGTLFKALAIVPRDTNTPAGFA